MPGVSVTSRGLLASSAKELEVVIKGGDAQTARF